MSSIKIVRIHNELLGTYGDRGNADVLAFRAKFHGITTEVIDVSYLEKLPTNGNIYLLGGAEDAAQVLSLEAIRRDNVLPVAIEGGAVVLAVCAGFQIIGNSFHASGKEVEGLGFLDVKSIPGKERFVGDIKVKSSILNMELTGFENHGGQSLLGEGVEPFGRVVTGHGNGDGKFDGAVLGNVFGTYMHGPVLARNPEFADLLLCRATGRKYQTIEDPLASQYAAWRRKVTK
jgi:CobQ-like glutamine amidotransferase family enzyme